MDTKALEDLGVRCELKYQSKYFTVVRATGLAVNHKGEEAEIFAEGVSRKSWRDIHDPVRGEEIAKGRALKALEKKLHKERCHHPLMNG